MPIKRIRKIVWSTSCIIFLIDIIAIFFLKDSIAIHFSVDEKPDIYATKWIIFILPLILSLPICTNAKYWKRSVQRNGEMYLHLFDSTLIIGIQLLVLFANLSTIFYNMKVSNKLIQNISHLLTNLMPILMDIIIVFSIGILAYHSLSRKNFKKKYIIELLIGIIFLCLALYYSCIR